MQRAVAFVIVGLAVAGCQVSQAGTPSAVEEPIAGIDERTGPIVDLGQVKTVDGDRVDLSAFANQAGGICLDEDDEQAPVCSPAAAPRAGVELDSWHGGEGRACVYGFATTEVFDVAIEEADTGRELGDAELLPASAGLGLHIFTGCYEDPSLTEVRLREK